MQFVDVCPCFDDGNDVRGRHVGECDVMVGREADYVAFSRDAFGAEEF